MAHLMGAHDWHEVDWATLNAANVAAIMAKVKGAPATRNKTLAALRGVAHAAWRMSLITAEERDRIKDVKGDRGKREPTGRNIEAWELHALIRVCAKDPTPAGARDAAMIALAAKTGARRAELAALKIEDMTTTEGGAEFRVIGKGNKERPLYVDGGAMLALNDWLSVRGRDPGPLFWAINKAGKLQPGHALSTKALHVMLQKRSAEAEISNISWHDFRRTVAGELLSAGEDISTVAGILGHSNVHTTAGYDRRPAEAKRKAVRKISVPYLGRGAKSDQAGR